MHGNIHEWCQDVYHDNYNGAPTDGSAWEIDDINQRVYRGGSWCSNPRWSRTALRDRYNSDETVNVNFGFRLVSFPPRTPE